MDVPVKKEIARRDNPREQLWTVVSKLVLDGISSQHTRRSYSQALDEFLIWFEADPQQHFNKATVQIYRT